MQLESTGLYLHDVQLWSAYAVTQALQAGSSVLHEIPPSHGKTMTIQTIANLMVQKDGVCVVVAVPNEYLVLAAINHYAIKQTTVSGSLDFTKTKPIKICAWGMGLESVTKPAWCKKMYLLLDEGDKVINHNAITVSSYVA